MRRLIQTNPFPVEAYFDASLVLAYAYPIEALRDKVPSCLSLDSFEDRWAFLAVAMVQTRRLRPKGFPECLGSDFFLTGYRLFVRYRSRSGRNLRGLYILRSETDRLRMRILGNLMTDYRYVQRKFKVSYPRDGSVSVRTADGAFDVVAREAAEDSQLPEGSPFKSWKEARRFAGPMPHTFSVTSNTVSIVKGVRSHWVPAPVTVMRHQVPFVREFAEMEPVLANAFIVRDVPYHWEAAYREVVS